MDEIARRLDYLRGNTPDVSPYNTREQNSRIIARKNNEKFVNQQDKQRNREISNLPKGIVNKRKSSMNFNFPETRPQTPQDQGDDFWRDVKQNWFGTPAAPISGPAPPPTSLFDYNRDFPPFPMHLIVLQTPEPRETSFLYPEGSDSPLRNRPPTIAPLPSRPSVDNFSRPITDISDEKNNTIIINKNNTIIINKLSSNTLKKAILQKNLFQLLRNLLGMTYMQKNPEPFCHDLVILFLLI